MANSQHRCVFVGNIPYDATEEKLIEICQEVGPVVSFRLVIDRETGKPKGYGFCEYKDEETALSARRNLQGYEINGRQLRVDFAENDKASGREQGRGGPVLAPSVEAGVPAVLGNPTQQHHQPVGLQMAITAADVIAGSLGRARPGMQGQLALANDPLTIHLSKLSRNQLNEVLSDMKVMATHNKELARQLLLGRPQLSKALFQAQIMLGMVAPQVLQMPNLVQTSAQTSHPPFQGNQVSVPQLPSIPIAQSSVQPTLLPKVQEGHVPIVPQNTLARTQMSTPAQIPMQPRVPLPQHANDHQAIQQPALRGNSLVSTFPLMQTHSSSSLSVRPQLQVASSSSNQQIPPSSLNNPQIGATNLVHSTQMVHSNAAIQQSFVPRHSMSDTRFQPGPSISSGPLQPTGRDLTNLPPSLAEKKREVSDRMESVARPSKIMKHDGGALPVPSLNMQINNPNGSLQPQVSAVASLTVNGVPTTSEAQKPDRQIPQSQFPSGGEESALLQQVMNLTPEQLSSLSPEQQQQVIQLQQMLRREQIQSS